MQIETKVTTTVDKRITVHTSCGVSDAKRRDQGRWWVHFPAERIGLDPGDARAFAQFFTLLAEDLEKTDE